MSKENGRNESTTGIPERNSGSIITEEERMMRRALFTPCETKDQLARWVRVFLGIDLPDCIVSEESNSSPMDALWEIYSKAKNNDDESFARVMSFANRGGGKTLSASILETLVVLHLDRRVVHMAAIFDQAKKSQEYVRDFFNFPYIRDFRVGQNVKKIEVCYYKGKGGDVYTESEWLVLDSDTQKQYERFHTYIQIVLCTIASANGAHGEFMCVDGDTKVLVKDNEGTDRDRRASTARGIFRRIAGLNPGGCGGTETELDVPVAKDEIFVLTTNPDTMGLEFKRVLRGHRKYSDRVEVKTQSGKRLVCTPDHPIWIVGKGFTQIKDIPPGSSAIILGKATSFSKKINKHTKHLNQPERETDYIEKEAIDEWEQVVMGSILGDAGIYRKPTNNAYLHEQHCLAQSEYLLWKKSIIERKVRTCPVKNPRSGYTGALMIGFRTGCSPLLNPYQNLKRDPSGIEKLGALGLAIWYQDDGCKGNGFRISTECWNKEQNQFLADFLLRKFGIDCHVRSYKRGDNEYFCIGGGIEAKRRLADICKPYIHPTMAYKFNLEANHKNCELCGELFWSYERGNTARDCGRAECRAISLKSFHKDPILSINSIDKGWVYDFTIEDNHNFFSNSILSKNCCDELDVIPKQNRRAYEESKHIPDARGGKLPITLLTSTRKFSYGLVQQEITDAAKTGLHIRHWNAVDLTAKCLPERHHPESPKQTYYINDSDLRHITEADYNLLDEQTQKKYYPKEGFSGCQNCAIFPACKSRLATHQTGNSVMLKPISSLINSFKSNSLSQVITQVLCRAPDESGLIYPKFNREIHMKTASEMAEIITATKHNPNMTKSELLELLQMSDAKFYAGVDFGFSNDFAVVLGAVWGSYVLIVNVISIPNLELDDKIEICKPIKQFNPTIFGDTEAPADIKTFARRGFNMKEWSKYPGSVKNGIEVVRYKMMPASGQPHLFLLKDDLGCEALASDLMKYHFLTDAAGQVSEEPDKEDDHRGDALRYLIMNVFAPNGKILKEANKDPSSQAIQTQSSPSKSNWMSERISSLIGDSESDSIDNTPIKKGKFSFSID